MGIDQLEPNITVRGLIFPEPDKVITTTLMSGSMGSPGDGSVLMDQPRDPSDIRYGERIYQKPP